MASNYVDTAGEDGRFYGHGHHHHHSNGTTPTGAAASPKMRKSWSSAASASSAAAGGRHGAAPKCVCAPATHAGSFKCRLHRSSSHGHGHPSSPTTAATPVAAVQSSSSRPVAAQ